MRLPPVLVFAIPVLAGWAFSQVTSAMDFMVTGQKLAASVILGAGALLLLLAITGFRLKQTTVNPLKPEMASALVTDGIYAISRNPMYLGMAMIAGGASLFLGHGFGLVVLMASIAYINEAQIKPEEVALTGVFGEEYGAYCGRVRRWV